MNELARNTTWYRALKILYIWSFALSIIVVNYMTFYNYYDLKSFLTEFFVLNLSVIIIFFAIKKSFFYILFGKNKNENKIENKADVIKNNPEVYSNEIGQSFTEEDMLKAAKYAGELLRDGKTPLEEVFSKPSKKYGVPEKVLHSLIKVDL